MKLADYSVYLPSGAITEPWELCATSAGHTRIPPGVVYPPGRHPDDHALSWARGRVLHAYQLVYITEGDGRFESPRGRTRNIRAGTVFILFPGVWHRYEPRRAVGWVEHWLELTGAAVDRLRRRAVISPANPLFAVGVRPELVDLFAQSHDLARRMPRGFQPVLATLGLQILARVVHGASAGPGGGGRSAATDESVQRAQVLISASPGRALNMEDVADEVGMSYSHFRRAFRELTGLSPKQYHLQLRLRKVQELLTGSSMSVKQIADTLGFDSPFHLSAQVKARTGLSPTQWREGGDVTPVPRGGKRSRRNKPAGRRASNK